MISLRERESAEKAQSALNASQKNRELLITDEVVNRYLAPPENTIYPYEYAFHLLGDAAQKTVLEYGCGDGVNTVVLSRRGANVIALDISSELLAMAKQRIIKNQCNATTLVLGSAHALPFSDESIDIIFGISILHHLDLKMASGEVHRVLKKGGRAIFLEPLRNSRLLSQLRRLLPKRTQVSPFERPLTDQEITEFSAPCEYRARTFQLPLSRLATFIPILRSPTMKMCNYIDALLLRLFPSLTFYGSIKVFQIDKH